MTKAKLLIFLTVIVLALFVVTFSSSLSSWLEVENLKNFLASYGVLAPVIFVLIYATLTTFLIPGSPLSILSGVLFGPLFGTVYTVIGASIGATLSFLLARYTKSVLVNNKLGVSNDKLKKIDEAIKKRGFLTVLILRLVPLFPFNVLNITLGLTSVKTRSYILATTLGIIPGTFVFVNFGSSLFSLDVWSIGLAVLLVGLLSVGGKWLMLKLNINEK